MFLHFLVFVKAECSLLFIKKNREYFTSNFNRNFFILDVFNWIFMCRKTRDQIALLLIYFEVFLKRLNQLQFKIQRNAPKWW